MKTKYIYIILIVMFLFYYKTEAQIDTILQKDIFDLSLKELTQVTVITAGKKAEKVSEIPASVVLLTRKDIERYGYRNILEILENIPGLFINKGYYREGVGVRGFYAEDNVIFLVNGENQYEVPIIPVEAIDRIEVIRGPMSILYGTGAFFGTINIITNEVTTNEKYQVSTSLGSDDTYQGFFKLSKKERRFKTTINTSLFHTEGLNIPYAQLINNPTRLPLLGVSKDQTTNHQLQRDLFTFNISTTINKFYTDVTYIQDNREIMYFYPSKSEGSIVKRQYNYITLGYKSDLFNFLSIDIKTNYYKRTRMFDFKFNVDNIIIPNFNLLNFYKEEYKESRLVSELNLFWKLPYQIQLTTGFYSRVELEGNDNADIPFYGSYLTNSSLYFVTKNSKAYTNAAFFQVTYKLLKKLMLVGGLRFEQMSKFDVHHDINQASLNPSSYDDTFKGSKLNIIPRFALIYSLNSTNHFKFLYGKAIHNPAIKDIYSDLWAIASAGVVKEHLQPETLSTIEISYSPIFTDLKINPSINLFRNNFSNMISRNQIYNPSNKKYYWLYTNYGEMVTKGVEFSIYGEPIDNFRFDLSVTYQVSEDNKTLDEKNNKVDVGNSPTWLAYAKIAYEWKNFTFAVTCNYVDTMLSAWDTKNMKRQANSVKSYLNSGINIRLNKIFNYLYFDFKIANIFDNEIRYTSGSDEFTQRGYLGERRTFFITLGAKF